MSSCALLLFSLQASVDQLAKTDPWGSGDRVGVPMDSSAIIAAGGGATHSGSATPGSASASSTASSSSSTASSSPSLVRALLQHLVTLRDDDPVTYNALQASYTRVLSDRVPLVSALTAKPLDYIRDQCFLNAHANKSRAYDELKLRVVVGSLALNGWFEYGGRSWKTLADWRANAHKGTGVWDAHCWLEDADGNVYDYVFPWYEKVAALRNARGPLKAGLIEKVSKKNCEKKKGLTYVPASPEVQAFILADVQRVYPLGAF